MREKLKNDSHRDAEIEDQFEAVGESKGMLTLTQSKFIFAGPL
jgi:hypothetical protein